MQSKSPLKQLGFTLVELLVVIAIIGIGQLQVNNNQREITK